MWVGKFDFRKQLPLALHILKATHNPVFHLDIYGSGNEKHVLEAHNLAEALDLKQFYYMAWKSTIIILLLKPWKSSYFFIHKHK